MQIVSNIQPSYQIPDGLAKSWKPVSLAEIRNLIKNLLDYDFGYHLTATNFWRSTQALYAWAIDGLDIYMASEYHEVDQEHSSEGSVPAFEYFFMSGPMYGPEAPADFVIDPVDEVFQDYSPDWPIWIEPGDKRFLTHADATLVKEGLLKVNGAFAAYNQFATRSDYVMAITSAIESFDTLLGDFDLDSGHKEMIRSSISDDEQSILFSNLNFYLNFPEVSELEADVSFASMDAFLDGLTGRKCGQVVSWFEPIEDYVHENGELVKPAVNKFMDAVESVAQQFSDYL